MGIDQIDRVESIESLCGSLSVFSRNSPSEAWTGDGSVTKTARELHRLLGEQLRSPGAQVIRYRDDLIRCFVDTEFYEDGETIDLISLGAVRSDGPEFYAVNSDADLSLVSPWVRENVLPHLPPYGDPAWMPRSKIADKFSAFTDNSYHGPPHVDEVWSYYADYDWVAICQMYGTMMKLPNHFPQFCMDLKQLSRMLGNPKHPEWLPGEHNALVDARMHRDLYEFLRKVPSP